MINETTIHIPRDVNETLKTLKLYQKEGLWEVIKRLAEAEIKRVSTYNGK